MTALTEAGNIDTVNRDLYPDRARRAPTPVRSLEEFHRLEQERAALADLTAEKGLLVGLASANSIASGGAKASHAGGAELAITYLSASASRSDRVAP